ncbi:MAG TPA: hypothetical protein VK680_07005 [Solirubrobacteraceae bacterium]|nr:hypothetical protein [Solirubrobacteraceae bacterium]
MLSVSALGLSVGSPALAATPEQPLPKPATGITATTAILHGELNPHAPGEPGEYQFFYKVSTEEELCRPEAESIPEPPAASLGHEKEAVEVEATSLQPSQTYAFCLVANPGFAQGPSLTFKTLGANPTVDSETASGTPFAATLEAQVNPNNQEMTYSFEYSAEATGEILEGTVTTLPGAQSLAPEFGERTASVPTGADLEAARTYFYRVVAKNATGTTIGKVEEFTTPTAEPPVVGSESTAGVTSTDARLEAKVNPNYQETRYRFEYAVSEQMVLEGMGTVLEGSPPAPPLAAVSEELPAGPLDLGSGLTPGETYFYRVVATNSAGVTEGPVQSFTTLAAAPILTAGDAEDVTATTAALSGSVDPHGGESSYRFAYISQADYEVALEEDPGDPFALAKLSQVASLPAGHEPVPVTLGVEELNPGTVYDFALVASNSGGDAVGPPSSFTTAAATPPLVSTGEAIQVTPFSARIAGEVDTSGAQSEVFFEFGTSPIEGTLLPATILPSSTGNVELIEVALSEDLLPGTTYYYRAVASSQDGTGYGSEQSFTTAGVPTPFASVTLSPVLPYTSFAEIEAKEPMVDLGPSTAKPVTKARLLAKALKACNAKASKRRAICEAAARKRYGKRKDKRTQ